MPSIWEELRAPLGAEKKKAGSPACEQNRVSHRHVMERWRDRVSDGIESLPAVADPSNASQCLCHYLLFEMNAQHLGRIEGAIGRLKKKRLGAQHENRID